MIPDLDIDLLRCLVAVVDSGGFTRAGERVHRTQSTVSQQIQRLEAAVGKPLLLREGRKVSPTDEGERLLAYARRILSLHDEARALVGATPGQPLLRLGITEDFASRHLTEVLARFARERGGARLDVRCDLSMVLRGEIERGELDVILVKQEPGERGGIATWRDPVHWVAAREAAPLDQAPLPLAVYPQGCIYRNRAIHALEKAGRAWRLAYTSPSLAGLQAAIASGIGIGPLGTTALRPDHCVLGPESGLPPLPEAELVLHRARTARGAAVEALLEAMRAALDQETAQLGRNAA